MIEGVAAKERSCEYLCNEFPFFTHQLATVTVIVFEYSPIYCIYFDLREIENSARQQNHNLC